MRAMSVTWLIAYAWTFALVEPAQIVAIAGAPCLWDENTRCGRCMLRCRFVYNEIFAP